MFSSSPRLIAAYRVFLRLPTPRHPPDALLLLVSRKKLPSIPMQLLKNRPRRVRQARAWFATGTHVPAPLKRGKDNAYASAWRLSAVVGLERLELSTSRLSGVRSNHLSYRPFRLVFSVPAASLARPPRSCMSQYTPVGSLAVSLPEQKIPARKSARISAASPARPPRSCMSQYTPVGSLAAPARPAGGAGRD